MRSAICTDTVAKGWFTADRALITEVATGDSTWATRLATDSMPLVVPVAIFMMLAGLFLIVSRKKALTQVIGYLVVENGIYAFGVAIMHEAPFLVEIGVLLDAFVAVFIMGIILFHINREFDHIDTDRLITLKDWTP